MGFADDVASVAVNHITEDIEWVTNEALEIVDAWVGEHGLELAHAKTKAVVLKWAYRQPELFSGGVGILVKRAVKYLGVTLDFTRHIRTVSASAAASARAIGHLMPNVGGPTVMKRRLLGSVVTSRLLYATPVWATRASRYNVNRITLGRAQRRAALRITRCYRTVSTETAAFLAEIPPVDLQAIERVIIRRRRSGAGEELTTDIAEARAVMIDEWQKR